MTLSDFRAGHHPIDDVEGAISTTPGYPAITQITFLACCAHYPGGSNRCLSTSSLFVLPSPVNGRVGIHDFTFGACSSFTHVAACQIACPPIADVCPEAPTQPVTRPSRSVATMLIDVYMDGSFPHWRSAPLRHTVNNRVGRILWVPKDLRAPPGLLTRPTRSRRSNNDTDHVCKLRLCKRHVECRILIANDLCSGSGNCGWFLSSPACAQAAR
jgi:hypothetical protein